MDDNNEKVNWDYNIVDNFNLSDIVNFDDNIVGNLDKGDFNIKDNENNKVKFDKNNFYY